MTANFEAFVDELEKISANLGSAAKSAIEAAKKVKLRHLKYPAVALGAIEAASLGRTAKRRYEIGKAYEEAQGA